jgi:NADPH-dependent curcumin reductase CurA
LAPGSGLERAKPVGVGEVMTGESVCEVIASDEAGYGPK